MTETLRKCIDLLPNSPGVYLMKDASETIIYIGKAKNLKKRVSQYFLRPQSGKVAAMVSHVDHFEFIVVKSEKEAFILEMNLIQTHYPRYNILLKDDSHYPYIALKKKDGLMLKIARSSKDSSYYYFGPFPSSSSAYETINLINKIFPTRKCKTLPKKPCLYYSLGQCLAPCVNEISQDTWKELYERIKSFLNGDTKEEEHRLMNRIEEASEKLDFETAAEYKKTLDALRYVASKQHVESSNDNTSSKDVFAFSSREGYLSIVILTYRRGVLLGSNSHVVPIWGNLSEQASELILQYYQNHELPNYIVTRVEGIKEDIESVYEGVEVLVPKEGTLLSFIDIASLNAKQALDAHFMSARLEDDNASLLEELGSLLHIKTPYRIELFDNSHLQGSSPVGAMVCYINGVPAKKMYRKFHLSLEDAGDDYHSMIEVVSRRYKRLKEEGQSNPDLILTDGGLTQVRAAKEALASIEVDIPVYGLYKNDKHQTEGLCDEDGNLFPLDNKSPLFFLLMRMQDEVHRYAISFHKQQRSKKMMTSIFDGIPGLGAKRKELLEAHYPSIDSLLSASVEELSQLIPLEAAEALYAKLHS